MKENITIKICGQTLTVSVDQGEKADLLEAAQKVDAYCEQIPSNDPKIKLLSTALTLAIESKRNSDEIKQAEIKIGEIIEACQDTLKKN